MNKTDLYSMARDAIERKRAKFIAALAVLDTALADLASAEQTAMGIVKRYSDDAEVVAAEAVVPDAKPAPPPPSPSIRKLQPPSKPPSPSKKKRGPQGGRPSYTPAEDTQIRAVGRGPGKNRDKFTALVRDMPGRTLDGLERRYQQLRKLDAEATGSAGDTPPSPATPEPLAVASHASSASATPLRCHRCADRPEGCFDDGFCMYKEPDRRTSEDPDQLGSKNSQIVEATVAYRAVGTLTIPDPARHYLAPKPATRPTAAPDVPQTIWPPKPGLPTSPRGPAVSVTGPLVDSGRDDQRVIDNPDAFRSRSDC